MHKLALFCVLVLGSAPAMAIYRCETGGKVSYSDEPCPGGKAIDVYEPGKAAAADATNQVAREKSELRHLQEERRKQEAAEQKDRSRTAKANASQAKKCKSLAMRKRWSEEDAAAANVKSAEKAKRNARRKAEKLELECGIS